MSNLGRDALRQLVRSDDSFEALCLYLDGGENPNQTVHGSDTLLHVAAQSRHRTERIVTKLIDAGAEIDSTTSQGHTPLHFAVMSRNIGAVQALLQAGAQVNIANLFGRTALHYAVDSRHPNRRHFHPQYNPAMWPYWMHNPGMGILLRLLDCDNIDVNPLDLEGRTPLMWAVELKHADEVKTLLVRGANPNIPNQSSRQNCLHVALAARVPNDYIITELLQNGTCIYDADNRERTPIDFLLGIYLDNSSIESVRYFLEIIAFKYRIREDLEDKVRLSPVLFNFLTRACQEVQCMSEQIIYGRMTLHDFASECFQEVRGEDAEDIHREICNTVVSSLLNGRYGIYLERILNLISKDDFCDSLESIVPPSIFFQNLIDLFRHSHVQNHEIFILVQDYYLEELRHDEHPEA